jgi:exodeoxyribonuclease VII large subunit
LERDFQRLRRDAGTRLEHLVKLLRSYSYEGVLERGYAVVRTAGEVMTRAAGAKPGQGIEVQFRDGRIAAVIGQGGGGAAGPAQPAKPPAKPRAKAKAGNGDDPQGSLL